jgi:WD40 repeat protein
MTGKTLFLTLIEGHTSPVASLLVVKQSLFSAGGNSILLRNTTTGQILNTFNGLFASSCLSLSGNSLFSGQFDSTVIRWNIATGEATKNFTGWTYLTLTFFRWVVLTSFEFSSN